MGAGVRVRDRVLISAAGRFSVVISVWFSMEKKVMYGGVVGFALIVVIVAVIVMVRPPYAMRATLLPVARTASFGTLSHDVAYFFNLSTTPQAGNTTITADVYGKSGMVRVTARADSARAAADTLRGAIGGVTENVRVFYGSDVALKVVHVDPVARRGVLDGVAPYALVIAVAAILVVGVLELWGTRGAAMQPTIPPWQSRHIFASVHPPVHSRARSGVARPQSPSGAANAKSDIVNVHAAQLAKQERALPSVKEKAAFVFSKTDTAPHTRAAADTERPVTSSSPTQAVPGNLPVVDLAVLGGEGDSATPTDTAVSLPSDEPTEEELKARLNALLGGKLS